MQPQNSQPSQPFSPNPQPPTGPSPFTQSPQPQQPFQPQMTPLKRPKSNLPLIIIAIVLLLIVIGAGVWLWLTYGNKQEAPTQDSSTNQQTQQPATEDYTGKTVALEVPATEVDGWKSDILDQNGTFRFKHAETGCQVGMNQTKGVGAAKAQGTKESDVVQALMDEAKKSGVTNFVVAASTDPLTLKTNTGKTVKFETAQVSFTGTDTVPYTVHEGAAWLGDTQILLLISCPTSVWQSQQSSITKFLNAVKLNIS